MNNGEQSNILLETSKILKFTGRTMKEITTPPFETREFFRQCYIIGYKTLPLIAITAFILGLVMTLQSRPVLVDFGAENLLPGMISVSIVREIGPVVTALICAGKIGSGIGAELGSMKVTEQIDAMEVSGVNPMKYLVSTRVLATTLMVPILVFFADAISFAGSFIAVNLHGKIAIPLYITDAFAPLHYYDIMPATIKTFFFGFAIGIVGCYKGYNAGFGTESVGRASNSAVVVSSLLIFIIDLIVVELQHSMDLMQF